jgi:hypothetical protein
MNPLLFNILFLDIETAANYKTYEELPERLKPLWKRKASYLKNDSEMSVPEMYQDRAAIYSEFGQVICIGIGGLFMDEKKNTKTKS